MDFYRSVLFNNTSYTLYNFLKSNKDNKNIPKAKLQAH